MQIYVSYCQSGPLNFFNWEHLILLPRFTKKLFTSLLVPDKIGVFCYKQLVFCLRYIDNHEPLKMLKEML